MLAVIGSMKELRFGQLAEVYALDRRAEQDFYQYLRECFFKTPGAVYCVWQEGSVYVSALRLEPYRDGLVLAGLETPPDRRNQGYAAALIRAVQSWLVEQGRGILYSHISHRNGASIGVHQKCGFRKILDHAVYVDGSVDSRAGTYVYEY